ELLVQLFVAPLRGEVEVELAERRQEAVGVVELDGRAARVADLEPVADRHRRALEQRLEEPGRVLLLGLHRLLALREHAHAFCAGPEGAHDDVAVRRVRAEEVVRVRMVAPRDELHLVADRLVARGHRARPPGRRLKVATQTDARAKPARPETGADKRRLTPRPRAGA